MIKQALKQVWKQRKNNGWLLTELIIVFTLGGMFMFNMFSMTYERFFIPQGFDSDGIYLIEIHSIEEGANEYDENRSDYKSMYDDLIRYANTLKSHDGVEALAISTHTIPYGSHNRYSGYMNKDSIWVYAEITSFLKGWDFWEVFRFKDVENGGWESLEKASQDGIIITKDFKRLFFGDKDDSHINEPLVINLGQDNQKRITGVTEYVKDDLMQQPGPRVFIPLDTISADELRYDEVLLSIRASERFVDEFENNIITTLKYGNIRGASIKSFDEFTHSWNITPYRRLMSFILFALIVVFLGVVGNFWMKMEYRRGEIGLRLAIGATERRVITQFIVEGMVMLGVSAIIGTLIILNLKYFAEIYSPSHQIPEAWPVNNKAALITFSLLITYFLMSIMVVIGTAIPTAITVKNSPSETLRDE